MYMKFWIDYRGSNLFAKDIEISLRYSLHVPVVKARDVVFRVLELAYRVSTLRSCQLFAPQTTIIICCRVCLQAHEPSVRRLCLMQLSRALCLHRDCTEQHGLMSLWFKLFNSYSELFCFIKHGCWFSENFWETAAIGYPKYFLIKSVSEKFGSFPANHLSSWRINPYGVLYLVLFSPLVVFVHFMTRFIQCFK